MQKVTFQFPDMHLLWSFAKTLKVHDFHVSAKKMWLTCQCDENFISEALTFYRARLIFGATLTNSL
jgi:hypothetical protein